MDSLQTGSSIDILDVVLVPKLLCANSELRPNVKDLRTESKTARNRAEHPIMKNEENSLDYIEKLNKDSVNCVLFFLPATLKLVAHHHHQNDNSIG